MLMYASIRPLSLGEFQEAMSVELGKTTMDLPKSINDVQGLLACCGSLIYLDEESDTLHFIHNSVKQFLLEDPLDSRPPSGFNVGVPSAHQFTLEEANLEMGGIMVTYLNYDELDTQISTKIPISMSHVPMTIVGSSLHKSKAAKAMALKLPKGGRGDMNIDIGDAIVAESGFYDRITVRQFHFRHYASKYWLDHTRTIHAAASCVSGLFKTLVARSDLVEGAHLWQNTFFSCPKVERRSLWAIDNSHYAFLRAELKLFPGSLTCILHAKPQGEIPNDLYIELLQAVNEEPLPRFVTASVARPKEYVGSLMVDSVVLRSLNKALSRSGTGRPYELEVPQRL